MTKIYLSLGSNIGDRKRNIAQAIDALPLHGVRVLRRSSLYETEPVEMTDQAWFVNCVVEAETDLQPDELMEALLSIEREMGRERLVPKGPRLIDIDILLYGSEVVRTGKVEIPHPRMAERKVCAGAACGNRAGCAAPCAEQNSRGAGRGHTRSE